LDDLDEEEDIEPENFDNMKEIEYENDAALDNQRRGTFVGTLNYVAPEMI
jgi:hypothetical protein